MSDDFYIPEWVHAPGTRVFLPEDVKEIVEIALRRHLPQAIIEVTSQVSKFVFVRAGVWERMTPAQRARATGEREP